MAEPVGSNSEPYEALLNFADVANAQAAASLTPAIVELIKIRVSQINGCAYCLRLHTRDALALGESTDRIAVLSAWRETSYFSETEQASLRVAEGVASVGRVATPHRDLDDTAPLSARQVRDAKWVAIAIDALNRLAITSHLVIAPD